MVLVRSEHFLNEEPPGGSSAVRWGGNQEPTCPGGALSELLRSRDSLEHSLHSPDLLGAVHQGTPDALGSAPHPLIPGRGDFPLQPTKTRLSTPKSRLAPFSNWHM